MSVLKGIRVLDLSRFQSGPHCGMMLGDMGAEVIRIEEPEGGADRGMGMLGPDQEALSFKIVGRNRKAVTLRLGKPEGLKILDELVKKSDVVFHNFTPGAPIAEKLSYERLKSINPSIIVAAITGFGQNGPYANQVCFDHVAQAGSGVMMLSGFPWDPPVKNSVTYNDQGVGTHAALGIVLALYHREKTGQGQFIDVSLFDTALFAAQNMASLLLYKVFGEVRTQVGNRGFQTYMGCFKAKDGWVFVSGSSNAIWKRLARAIGRNDMAEDPKFSLNDMVRFDHAEDIDKVIQEWAAPKTVGEITEIFNKARVPCSVVNTIDKLEHDPHVAAREMIIDVEYPGLGKIPLPGIPIKLSLTPGSIALRAPEVGEHNREIYGDLLGFSLQEIDRLKAEDII